MRRAWNADRRTRAATVASARTWPAYGSREWLALPEESPLRWCGVLLAAECWARAGDELEESSRAEVELAARAHKADEDADYLARRDAHRAEFGGMKLARGAFVDSDEFGRLR